MSSNWVDFKELRERLRFADVLRGYDVELKVRGDRATGLCPLPGHPRHEGKRRTPSFSAHLARGLFNCFGCHAHGNAIDFACYMEGVDPSDAHALRKVALDLQDRFLGSVGKDRSDGIGHRNAERVDEKADAQDQGTQQKPDEGQTRPVIVNAPLNFTLKALDPEHPYLKRRGLTAETVVYFGLGYCSRGLMEGRIVIPLHDAEGRLVGYAGRLVDDDAVDAEHPKYLLPGDRERDGVLHRFRKSLLLFNAHRISRPVDDLIVVEGFVSVFWLAQHGYGNVVALMGSSCSPEQAALITERVSDGGRVWALTDGDEAGRRCAQDLLTQVAPHRCVRWAVLADGRQPTDYAPDDLARLLPPLAGKGVADVGDAHRP